MNDMSKDTEMIIDSSERSQLSLPHTFFKVDNRGMISEYTIYTLQELSEYCGLYTTKLEAIYKSREIIEGIKLKKSII